MDYLGRVVIGDWSCCLTKHGAIISVTIDELLMSLPVSRPNSENMYSLALLSDSASC